MEKELIVAGKEPKLEFTKSDVKYGLWSARECLKNGKAATVAELLMPMFVLNGDAGKSLEAAKVVLEVKAQLDPKAVFTLTAAKPITDPDVTEASAKTAATALYIKHILTGAEIVARAEAIVALANTEKEPTILYKSDKTRQPAGKKNLAAGLI